jgi:hypothetical protein
MRPHGGTQRYVPQHQPLRTGPGAIASATRQGNDGRASRPIPFRSGKGVRPFRQAFRTFISAIDGCFPASMDACPADSQGQVTPRDIESQLGGDRCDLWILEPKSSQRGLQARVRHQPGTLASLDYSARQYIRKVILTGMIFLSVFCNPCPFFERLVCRHRGQIAMRHFHLRGHSMRRRCQTPANSGPRLTAKSSG